MSQMLSWAFEPADEDMLKGFIARGEADANAWAHAMGVADMASPGEQPDQNGQSLQQAELAAAPAAVSGN